MFKRPTAELAKLLGHVDQRVRLEAQYELADRAGFDLLASAALATVLGSAEAHPLARLHAVWALGQVARRSAQVGPVALAALTAGTTDRDAEVRAQVVKTLGEQPRVAGLDARVSSRS